MSDRVAQSYHGRGTLAAEPVRRHESVWMAHWMSTGCKSATQAASSLSVRYESKEEVDATEKRPMLSGSGMATDILAEGSKEETKAKAADVIGEGLETGPKRQRRERLDFQPFPMFGLSQKREGILALKNVKALSPGEVPSCSSDSKSGYDAVSLQRSESHLTPKDVQYSLGRCFQPGGTSQYLEEQGKSQKDLEASNLPVLTALPGDFVRSSVKVMQYGFRSRRIPLPSFMSRQEEIKPSNAVLASKEQVPNMNYSYSPVLAHENKDSNFLDSETQGKSLLKRKDAALSLYDPSTSGHQQTDFVRKRHLNTQNYSGMELFPSQSSPPDVRRSEKLNHGCYSPPKLPCSVHDVETMRIFTAVDSTEKASRIPSKFSQTTRHFLFTKKSDADLPNECQMFSESIVSAKFKAKHFSDLGLSADLQFHVQEGVKLQPLGSSRDTDRKEKVRDQDVSAGLENESSADTDTMDMDAFRENNLLGVASSLSNKYPKGTSSTSQAAGSSAREVMGGRLLNGGSSGMNQELTDLPAMASPAGCMETSTSRTESLDVGDLSHAEEAIIPKSNGCADGAHRSEPSCRWIKRLKLNGSGSSHGTKISKMGQASSHRKVNKLFGRMLRRGMASSEPAGGRTLGKEKMEDQNAVFLRNDKPSTFDSVTKSQGVTLSHPWIRRWCQNRTASPQKKPQGRVVCEPECSKATDEFQKKQFPSIAAMALMGKAVCGFHPCELKKGGSFVVWNT